MENNKIKYDDITERYYETPYLTTEDVRPITIQSGWIRLCNRLVFSSNRLLTKQLCLDKQIGIGCPSGAQALIGAAKIGIDIIKKDPNKAMMKLDFRNCYNTIDRQKVINIVNQLAPELTNLYYQRYNEPYMLIHSDGTRDIFENGMAQGCNLSTAALGAIQKDAERKIIRNCKGIKADWKLDISGKYHDDATDVANIDDLLLYFEESTKVYKEYGMEFTPKKSELIINRNVRIDQLPQVFQQFIISVEQVEILGIPIGNIDYMNENVIFKLLGARRKLQTIKSFDSDKTKTDMIRKFNGTSKLMYLFSNIEYTPDETEYKKELKKLDEDKIMTAVETALTPTQREQLELPVSMTGIGIGGMTDIIPAMVLSNHLKIKDKIGLFIKDKQILTTGIQYLETQARLALKDYQNILCKFGTCTCNGEQCKECTLKNIQFEDFLLYRIGLNKDKHINFKYLSNVLYNLKLQHVYANSTPQHRIVLNQIHNSNIASKYITANKYESNITNPEWHYLMMRRIGKTVNTQPVYCPYCDNHPLMDPYGNHAASCPSKGHRIGRHDRIKYQIAKLCRDANIRHKVEPKQLTKSNRRPADILVYGIEEQGLALDVGITDAASRYNTAIKRRKEKAALQDDKNVASQTNGYYANTYYKHKIKFFHQAKFNFGYETLKAAPIIIESFGYVDPRSLYLLNKIITLAAKNMNKSRADINHIFKTKISNILAKADAKAGLARYYYSYDNSYCRF